MGTNQYAFWALMLALHLAEKNQKFQANQRQAFLPYYQTTWPTKYVIFQQLISSFIWNFSCKKLVCSLARKLLILKGPQHTSHPFLIKGLPNIHYRIQKIQKYLTGQVRCGPGDIATSGLRFFFFFEALHKGSFSSTLVSLLRKFKTD